MFIEAENLEALKILQKSYAGSVKMIYIDPPYNTGSDSFIYPDKFSESRKEYARRVGDTDDAGYLKRDGVFQGAWRKNGKDSGHYHSNWLSMMLPRLHLAKTLLREDGVIFISIDDNEQAQLKLLCDEVFGAENFVAEFIWKSKLGRVGTTRTISTIHEYILCYSKSLDLINLHMINTLQEGRKENLRQWGQADRREDRPSMFYPILIDNISVLPIKEDGTEGRWRVGQETAKELLAMGQLELVNRDGKYQIYRNFPTHESKTAYESIIPEDVGTTANGARILNSLSLKIFDYSKSVDLIKFILKLSTSLENEDNIILDFFSGSGTTAHAVMQLNAEDGGSRRFICVQLPEETDEKSEARKAGFNTIAEIAKERIRRAGSQISDGLQSGQNVDTGFKVFKLVESGFKQWRQPGQADTEALQGELLLNIDSVLSGTLSENLLYELMLRMGLKLTCKVSFSGDVYFVEDEDTGGLYAFLLERVNQGLIDAVLAKHPIKVAALDRLFEGDDALKSNTVLQMKDAGVMFECV